MRKKNNEPEIDEYFHEPVPTVPERLGSAIISIVLGYLLVHIIGFWMFPGVGLYGFFSVFSYSPFSAAGETARVLIMAWLAICAVMGWFNTRYFTDRLAAYLKFWKFW